MSMKSRKILHDIKWAQHFLRTTILRLSYFLLWSSKILFYALIVYGHYFAQKGFIYDYMFYLYFFI